MSVETRRAWRDSLGNIIGVAHRCVVVEELVGVVGELGRRMYMT
jgi:hypothetical protein